MIYWVFWFIIGLILIAVFSYLVLPKLLFKTYSAFYTVRDRFLGKFNLKDGVSFLYEPAIYAKKYLKKYQIYQDATGKYFLGEWRSGIFNADYDLIVFDSRNRITEVISVKEEINGNRYTRLIRLPEEADFVSPQLKRVDEISFPREMKINGFSLIWLLLFSLGLALAVDLFLWLSVTFILRWLDEFSVSLAIPIAAWAALLGYTALGVTVITFTVSVAKMVNPSRLPSLRKRPIKTKN